MYLNKDERIAISLHYRSGRFASALEGNEGEDENGDVEDETEGTGGQTEEVCGKAVREQERHLTEREITGKENAEE